MKKYEDINSNPKPMFYACILEGFRKIALKCGYALAVHGSCASDLDLIAVRWKENYESPTYLVTEFLKELSQYTFGRNENGIDFIELTNPQVRFNTHTHYSIPIIGDWYVDLCVII